MQPWGKDRARQAIVISVHNSAAEAFAESDRLADRMVCTGDRPDAVELIVVDNADNLVLRRAH